MVFLEIATAISICTGIISALCYWVYNCYQEWDRPQPVPSMDDWLMDDNYCELEKIEK
jgi:hypothetical protein